MEGIEKIIKKIEEDAAQEAERIVSEANAKASETVFRYKEQAEEAINSAEQRAKEDAEQSAKKSESSCELRARNIILVKKRGLIEQAFDKAYEKLCSMQGGEYKKILVGMAVKAAPDGRGALVLSEKDRSEYGQSVVSEANAAVCGGNGQFTLSEQTADIRGGLIVSDGDIEANCSFDMLIDRAKEDLSVEVSKILFG